jgi:hypothetical protein
MNLPGMDCVFRLGRLLDVSNEIEEALQIFDQSFDQLLTKRAMHAPL